MKSSMSSVFTALVVVLLIHVSYGMIAINTCEEYTLPGDCDTVVCLKLKGNPWQHILTTGGYSLCHRETKDGYNFATVDITTGLFTCSDVQLSCTNPTPPYMVSKGLVPPANAELEDIRRGEDQSVMALRRQRMSQSKSKSKGRGLQVETLKNLVLMIRFTDHPESGLPSSSDYDTLFNNVGPATGIAPTGSVRDVYEFNLYGDIVIESVVTGWIAVPYSESDAAGPSSFNGGEGCTGTCSSALLRTAIVWALNKIEDDAIIDFDDFDLDGDNYVDIFTVIHSGHGAESGGSNGPSRIWSHKWALPTTFFSNNNKRIYNYNINPGLWGQSGSSIGRIGVISHEMGHFLGLPDLYDTDYSSDGIGSFGLMANSWGYDYSQQYPPSFSAWSKEELGVVNIVDITTDGTYVLPAVQDTPTVYRLTYTHSGVTEDDYLLIEYRRATGFDSQAPGGILIWHIDPDKTSNRDEGYPSSWPSDHYKVRLIQADGDFGLELGTNPTKDADDWFKNGGEISDLTSPDLKAYGYIGNSNKCSGHLLKDFSAAGGASMSFVYQRMQQDCSGVPLITPSPTSSEPTPLPTTLAPSSIAPTNVGVPPSTHAPTSVSPTSDPTVTASPTSDPTSEPTPPTTTFEWACSPGYYDASDGCDCECGSWDPDCDEEGTPMYCWAVQPNGLPIANMRCEPSTGECVSTLIIEEEDDDDDDPDPANTTGPIILLGAAGAAGAVLIAVAAALFSRKRSRNNRGGAREMDKNVPAFATTVSGPGGHNATPFAQPMGYSQSQPPPARNYPVINPMFGANRH